MINEFIFEQLGILSNNTYEIGNSIEKKHTQSIISPFPIFKRGQNINENGLLNKY